MEKKMMAAYFDEVTGEIKIELSKNLSSEDTEQLLNALCREIYDDTMSDLLEKNLVLELKIDDLEEGISFWGNSPREYSDATELF